jgi:peptidoglycan/xylan/chitin deacetylase (PgdA/CDA1 family)
MNRRMEPRALSAVADRVTSDGSPETTEESARETRRPAPDNRGQDLMNDREKDVRASAEAGEAERMDAKAQASGGADPGAAVGLDGAHHPRLDRPTQTRIGDQLRSMYAELMDQPVPDRFRSLLDQLDDPARKTKPDREDGR